MSQEIFYDGLTFAGEKAVDKLKSYLKLQATFNNQELSVSDINAKVVEILEENYGLNDDEFSDSRFTSIEELRDMELQSSEDEDFYDFQMEHNELQF